MDTDGLLTIGRFARLTDLSPRLLRRLDERGLLSPALVDPDTRYRYYDLGQTRVASLIHLGRQMGLTVDQLADLIAAAEAGELRAHLRQHRDGVAARVGGAEPPAQAARPGARARRASDVVRDRAQGPFRPILVMSARGAAPRTHPHDPWLLESAIRQAGATVLVHIARQGAEPAAQPVVLYDTDFARDDEIRFEVCFPVAASTPLVPGRHCKELPAERVAYITFQRPLRHDLERPRRAARVDRRERPRRVGPGPRDWVS